MNSVTYVIYVPDGARVGYSIPAGETSKVNVVWKRGGDGIAAATTVNAGATFVTKVELNDGQRTKYGVSNRPMYMRISGDDRDD